MKHKKPYYTFEKLLELDTKKLGTIGLNMQNALAERQKEKMITIQNILWLQSEIAKV